MLNQQSVEHMLIIEDDPSLSTSMSEVLAEIGIVIDQAHSCQDAYQFLTDRQYDLILLDNQLGDGEGIDVLRWFHDQPHETDPAIIMISESDEQHYVEECYSLGIVDFLRKPKPLPLLLIKVRKILESHRLKQKAVANQISMNLMLSQMDNEQQMARFIYQHLHQSFHDDIEGLESYIQPHSLFSGDMVMTCIGPNGHCFGLMADATGHGLAAALTMMPVLTVMHTMVVKGFSLGLIAREINRKVNEESPDDRFVAAILFEMDPHRRTLDVWNGGMPPALWVDPDKGIVQRFASRHLPLGILDKDAFDGMVETFSIPNTGHLVAYSDGLVEQRNSIGEPLSQQELERVVELSTPGQLIYHCLELLTHHTDDENLDDDVSLMSWVPEEAIARLVRVPNQTQYTPGHSKWQYCLKGKALSADSIMEMANKVLRRWLVSLETQQRAYTVIAELVNNAFDHGCLGVSSNLKIEDFELYLNARQTAIENLSDDDWIQVCLSMVDNQLNIEVKDSGDGYFGKESAISKLNGLSGRGIGLIRALSSDFVVDPPGNVARSTLSLIGQDSNE
ncbi:fused response regulator/phosphatase [Reinekea blandensis]|uniref:Response regulator n=1 Tax=Reinekea blandensis MED297 TaxID=314283 RepID=A4BJG1_9GAMM|nr:fused response regulator/phosphatase [Reinekea blandensis]EAR07733.1 response regulator [Reinekea sp. MED297] [Reinekea blandensis MED297]